MSANNEGKQSEIPQLSLIVTTCSNRFPAWESRKRQIERAVSSLLQQNGAHLPKFEVIVIQDSLSGTWIDHLQDIFRDEIATRRLHLHRVPTSGDSGKVRNHATSLAQGRYLAFVDPLDSWNQQYLSQVVEHLDALDSKHVIFCLRDDKSSGFRLSRNRDWLRLFLSENLLLPSSIIIKASLFEKVGKFSEGYGGVPFPKKVPGLSDYELLIRTLILLKKAANLNESRPSTEIGWKRTTPLKKRPWNELHML